MSKSEFVPEFIPIEKKSGLWLFALALGGEEFAARFRAVWRKLPLAVRRRLKKHWRSVRWECMPSEIRWPLIELWECELERGNSPSRAVGGCSWRGDKLTFDGEFAAGQWPVVVESTIAHELAHVYLIARDGCEQHSQNCGTPATYYKAKAEIEADQLAVAWGFWRPPRRRPRRRRRQKKQK